MEDWKQRLGEAALQRGVIKDPQWLERLDDSMPVWAVLQMMLELLDRLEPEEYMSYD
ncbi:hypothetical protein RAC89_02405 [Paenibacillus sp. GD4]|uniref:hypothetical protein n=1 Tax=Paenibacillus sp. GD4 TaxID=3068890 RepID=UPI002796C3BF|nr:hypothetical protein [Paenibacillus sp. GD4]MDQ1909351.1 hypothetical protein [Paenibacillus sp. GD4]